MILCLDLLDYVPPTLMVIAVLLIGVAIWNGAHPPKGK